MTEQMAATLRAAIIASGYSANQLSKLTGVNQPSISDFLRGYDIRLATAQRLADFLNLELVEKPPKKK